MRLVLLVLLTRFACAQDTLNINGVAPGMERSEVIRAFADDTFFVPFNPLQNEAGWEHFGHFPSIVGWLNWTEVKFDEDGFVLSARGFRLFRGRRVLADAQILNELGPPDQKAGKLWTWSHQGLTIATGQESWKFCLSGDREAVPQTRPANSRYWFDCRHQH